MTNATCQRDEIAANSAGNAVLVRPGGKMSTKAYSVVVKDSMTDSDVMDAMRTAANALDSLAAKVADYHAKQGILQAASDLWDTLAYCSKRGV